MPRILHIFILNVVWHGIIRVIDLYIVATHTVDAFGPDSVLHSGYLLLGRLVIFISIALLLVTFLTTFPPTREKPHVKGTWTSFFLTFGTSLASTVYSVLFALSITKGPEWMAEILG